MAKKRNRRINKSLLITLDNSIANLGLNSKEIEQVLEALILKTKKEKVKLTKEDMFDIQLAISNINDRLDKLTGNE